MNRRNRSRFRAVISSPVTLVLVLALLVVLARAAARIHAKATESSGRLAQAEANLAKLEGNREVLQTRIADLSTDAGIEASIREKYHAVQPGESVAVIVDADSAGASRTRASGAEAATSTESGLSWWQRLWRALGL